MMLLLLLSRQGGRVAWVTAACVYNLHFTANIGRGGCSRRSQVMRVSQSAGISTTTKHLLAVVHLAGQALGNFIVVLNDTSGAGAASSGSRCCSSCIWIGMTTAGWSLMMIGRVSRGSWCHRLLMHVGCTIAAP